MRTIYKRYEVDLSADDIMDVSIRVSRGEVLAFALNYRARFGADWREVARYDTCHGFAHLHRFWLRHEDQVTPIHKGRAGPSLNVAIEQARQDILGKWRSYRARMEGTLP